MKSKVAERMLKTMPLETEIKVSNEMSFINLIHDLGFREHKMWTPDEDELFDKLMKLSDEHTKHQMEIIKKWLEDGRPLEINKVILGS